MKRWISVLALSTALAAVTLTGCSGGSSTQPAGTPASGGSSPDKGAGEEPPKEPASGGYSY